MQQQRIVNCALPLRYTNCHCNCFLAGTCNFEVLVSKCRFAPETWAAEEPQMGKHAARKQEKRSKSGT